MICCTADVKNVSCKERAARSQLAGHMGKENKKMPPVKQTLLRVTFLGKISRAFVIESRPPAEEQIFLEAHCAKMDFSLNWHLDSVQAAFTTMEDGISKGAVVGDDLAKPNGTTPATEEGSVKSHPEMVTPERIQGDMNVPRSSNMKSNLISLFNPKRLSFTTVKKQAMSEIFDLPQLALRSPAHLPCTNFGLS